VCLVQAEIQPVRKRKWVRSCRESGCISLDSLSLNLPMHNLRRCKTGDQGELRDLISTELARQWEHHSLDSGKMANDRQADAMLVMPQACLESCVGS